MMKPWVTVWAGHDELVYLIVLGFDLLKVRKAFKGIRKLLELVVIYNEVLELVELVNALGH